MSVDFEAEGLLEGTEGRARAARLELLRELHAQGVSLGELRDAVAEGRLALLPVERELAGGEERYTLNEVAEEAQVDVGFLVRQRQAYGLPAGDADERQATEEDLAAARRARALLEAGLPEEGLLEVTRVIGLAMSQIAAANRSLIVDALVAEGDTELDVARRFAAAARSLQPLVGETLTHALRLRLREQVRHDVLDTVDPAGAGANRPEITACFADLVGFTRLGERLPMEEIGHVTGHLNELAADAASEPVRLVKLMGDGALLVSVDNDALLAAAIALAAAADAHEDFPQLRVGLARGGAITRGGDWYGPPVNAASRITAIAYPGSVLVSEAVKEAASAERFRFSFAGQRRLKGIRGEQPLFRVRLREAEA